MSNEPELAKTLPERRQLSTKPSNRGDKIFARVTSGAAHFSIALVLLILAFLVWRAWPALTTQGIGFFTGTKWSNDLEHPVFQIAGMLYGSLLLSFLGLLIAVPTAIAVAYFIEFMAGPKVGKVVTLLIDLLAALPSVVLGLWGFLVFSPVAAHWAETLHKVLGFLPIFSANGKSYTASPFIAGWVVGIMIIPIITSVTREIFSQVDRDLINGAKALGGSQVSILRRVILPVSSGGITGGVLLGLGRALGETVAVLFVLNLTFGEINFYKIIENHGGSIASNILSRFGEATPAEISALMASGLVLFISTLIINSIASWIVAKAQPWRQS